MHRKFFLGVVAFVALTFSVDGVALHARQGRGHGQGKPAGAGKPASKPAKPNTPREDGNRDHARRGARPPAGELATRNPHLAARLQALLPGVNLETAGAGFKNLGQFVAAAHVSHNLDIPFDQLKGRMTGANATSLGGAIHELKPAANADAEAKKASRGADDDIKESQRKKSSS